MEIKFTVQAEDLKKALKVVSIVSPQAQATTDQERPTMPDLFVFLDVDCIPAPGLVADYVEHRRPGLLMGAVSYLPAGVPGPVLDWTVEDLHRAGRAHPARPAPASATPTTAYELFWSLNFAVDRGTWETIGGFDERFAGYGGEDTDFGYQARAAGVPAWFLPGAHAFHQHHPVEDPPVRHLHDIVSNARRFHAKWGEWPMTGWLSEFAEQGLVDWDDESLRLRAAEAVS